MDLNAFYGKLFKSAKTIFWLSFILCVFARFQVYKLPHKSEILAELHREPAQTATSQRHFILADPKRPIRYEIQPLFDYDLYGLVVSYHHSKDDFVWTKHSYADDYLNSLDVCVVWGENIRSGAYQKVNYSHGDWTCYWQSKWGDSTQWRTFNGTALSNSHLLPADQQIEKLLLRMRPGDQIHVRGQLVNYKATSQERFRNTSTIRGDTGNGACEIIYVTSAQILKIGNSVWRWVYLIAKIVLVLSIILLIVDFMELPYFNRESENSEHE